MAVFTAKLAADLRENYSYLTLDEVSFCFELGAKEEYGEIMGINLRTITKWLKAYKTSELRYRAKLAVEAQKKALPPVSEAYNLQAENRFLQNSFRRYKESRRPHPLASHGSPVEAAVYKARRDDANLTAKECRARRDEWNDRGARMRASGGLGDIGECKSQANSWHQKAVKASEDANTAHEKMHQLYDEADRLRAEAQKCHEQYLDCKRGADAEHTRYIQAVRSIERVRENLPDRGCSITSPRLIAMNRYSRILPVFGSGSSRIPVSLKFDFSRHLPEASFSVS